MKKWFLGLLILFVLCFAGSCLAIDDFTVTDHVYDPAAKAFGLIINDNRASGMEANSAAASVEGVSVENIDLKFLGDSDVPVTFVFVVDTTTTNDDRQKNRAFEIADAISSERSGKNDSYYLIAFDTEVHAAVGPKQHPVDILKNISYSVAGVGDYSDALMNAVKLLDSEPKSTLRKKVIILLSDGYQVSSPRFSQTDLIARLRESGYPVFTCGLAQSEANITYQENLLSPLSEISRETGGLYFSYKGQETVGNKTPGRNIADRIQRSMALTGVLGADYTKAEPGWAELNIRLMRNESEVAQLNASINITEAIVRDAGLTQGIQDTIQDLTPVILEDGKGSTEPTPGAEVVTDICQTDPNDPSCTYAPVSFFEKCRIWLMNTLGPSWMLILIAALLFIALVVLIILTVLPGFKKIKIKPGDPDNPGNGNGGNGGDELGTRVVVAWTISLEDMNTGRRYTKELSSDASAIFGRVDDRASDVVGLGGDPHISRKQFMLTATENDVFIEHLGSVNGTYVNGSAINERTELKNGYRVRVGQVAGEREFSVIIRKNS